MISDLFPLYTIIPVLKVQCFSLDLLKFFFGFVLYILQFQFFKVQCFSLDLLKFFFGLTSFSLISFLFQSFSPLFQSFRVIFLGIWVQIRSNPLILLDFCLPNHPNSVISGHSLSFLLSILTPKPYITIFQLANRHKKTIFSGIFLKIITRNSLFYIEYIGFMQKVIYRQFNLVGGSFFGVFLKREGPRGPISRSFTFSGTFFIIFSSGKSIVFRILLYKA